jgi:1-pyrroline-5-carboxylate dehydrogenase
LEKIGELSKRRTLDDLTVGPVLTWDNRRIQHHVDNVLKVPGAKLLFGGSPLTQPHKIPTAYGSYQPTAVQVPLD